MTHRGEFPKYLTSAVALGLVAVLVGVLVLVIDATFGTNPWSVAVAGVASTVLSVGLITVLYDAVLKRIFTNELLQLIQIATALRAAGVDAITHETNLDWKHILARASEFRLVLVEPTGWLEREWPHVLAAARGRKVRVDVCLPKADGSAIALIAQQLHLEPNEYRGRVEVAITSMSESWRTADPPLTPHSALTVYSFDGVPSHSLVIADQRVVMMVHSTLGRVALDTALAISFDGDAGSYPTSWLLSQVRGFAKFGVVYSNEVAPIGR